MAPDESTPTDFNTGYVPSNPPRLSAIPLHLQPDSSIQSLGEIENILSLIDFEFFQYQRSVHNADKAPRTITKKSRFVGNGLTFAVWKFSSGRSKLMTSFQGWKKRLKKANADPSSSDSFILKRPLINHGPNNAEVTNTTRLKAVLTEIKVLAHPPVSNHPNIVDLLGFLWDTQESGENSIAPSIIMEDALLGSLEAFQKPDFLTLALDMKMEIVLDIAKGLDVLHDSGIVHGDLKSAFFEPNSLFLDDSNIGTRNVLLFTTSNSQRIQAKLSDFGCSILGVNPTIADLNYRLVGRSLPWTAPEYKDTMSGKGILSTDLYCFGLLSWRILLNGHSPFDHISPCTPQTQGSREAKSHGCQYFFTESTVTSHDSEKPKRLNSVEIQDLKGIKGNELLRLAHSTTKTWPQWTSRVSGFSTPEILGMFSSIFSKCLRQNPQDRASSMKDIMRISDQDEKKTITPERIGDRRQAIFTYKFPMYIHQLRLSHVGFRALVIHLFETIATADRPKSANKARAALCLAICHLQQIHPNSNKPEALQWLVTAAQEGDVLAQSYIQRLHDACQLEVPPKLPIAQWLRRASDQGLAAAWMDLQKLGGQEDVPFRPYQIPSEAFSSLGLHDQNRLKKSLLSLGSSEVLAHTTPDGESLLHYAAATGMCEVVFAIGKSDYNVNCKNRKNMTPLHLGCWNSQHSAIKGLLSLGADVNSLASGNITPLHLAVASLNFATVDILLHSKSDIHIQSLLNLEEVTGRQESYYSDFRGTALHWAVCRGLVDITEALLRRGADPTVENVDGYSAFSFAAMRHDLVMLEILFGLTPLDKDTKNQISQEVVLEAGRAHSLQSMLCTRRPSFDSFTAIIRSAASYDRKALLSQAIENRSVQIVQYLVEKQRITNHSALIETYLYDNITFTTDLSLNGLLWSSASNASAPLVKLLLSLGADPQEPSIASRYGGGILHSLASGTNIDCSDDEVIELVKLLVDKGADINFQDPDTKSTPLHTAVFRLKPRLVEAFLSCGANPLAKKANGHTPYLNLLTDNYSWTAIDTLTALIEDPGILLRVFNPSDHMTNFFHILSEAPEMARDDSISAKICKMLVGKLKNLPDGQKLLRAHLEQSQPFTGFTPLHCAVSSANEEVAECILQEGGDVNAKAMGQTPMTLAINRNVWKTYLNVVNMWPIEKAGEERDFRTEAWIQSSHQDGWLKWQERSRRMVMLLKKHGGTESSLQDVLTALEEPFRMGSFFRSLGISDDALSGMVKDLASANEAEGVVIEEGLGFLEQ